MDWMYTQSNTKTNTKEDFFGMVSQKPEEPEPKKKIVPIVRDSAVNEDYEAFVRFHEDPLVAIMHEQERAKADVLDNPLKLREIQREIEMLKEGKRKHKKHHHHHHKNKSDKKNNSNDSDEKISNRDRSRDKSSHRHHHKHSEKEGKTHRRHDSRSRSRDREREREKLGPTKEIIEQYKEIKELEAFKRKQKNSYKNLTEEEKNEKVEEMKRAAMDQKISLLNSNADDKEENQERMNPNFIRNMRADVYTKGSISVEDKIKRNMHYNQKLSHIKDQDED